MKRREKKRAARRAVAVFAALCVLFAGIAARLAYLQTRNASLAAEADEKRIGIAVSRGYIYDRHLTPLVNTGAKNVAAAVLSEAARRFLPEELPAGAFEKSTGICVTLETGRPVPRTMFTLNVKKILRYPATPLCAHLIGYTDAGGYGVCGVEKSYDKILQEASGSIAVLYTANVYGQAIAAGGIRTVNDGYNNPAGVVLTIDSRIQQIAEKAVNASAITRGAAVVLDVHTGEILALVSVPVYDVNDLASSLQDPRLPFLNRALSAYPVGSVFKPFIAAAALEHGGDCPGDFSCTGAIDVQDLRFRCYRSAAHGVLDLSGAVCHSCNCYFIGLGLQTGASAVTETASAFGFGREVRLTGDLKSAAGVLPAVQELTVGGLANLSFGQGALLASPLQLAAAFAAIANGGIYRAPYLMKALVDRTQTPYAYYKNEDPTLAADAATCSVLSESLYRNMLEGTGRNGCSAYFSSAGKTATAQTGHFLPDGSEQLCTWFCGYFPYESPRYAVVVFNEYGTAASEDCAPVFQSISEGIFAAGLLK